MRLRESYDWVVLGDSPGALLSACIAAKMGQSVLIAPLDSTQWILRSETRDYLDFESNCLFGLGLPNTSEGFLGDLFRWLGIYESLWQEQLLSVCEPQLLAPHFRMQFKKDEDAFQKELIREFGVSSFPDQDEAEIRSALSYWTYTSPYPQESSLSPMQLVKLARSAASFRGGLSAYRNYLKAWAKNSGAHVLDDFYCRKLFIENGKFVGLHLTGHGNMISATAGVLGCSLEEASERVSVSGKNLFHRLKKPVSPLGWKFTLGLSLHREGIPLGATPMMLWQEQGAPGLEIQSGQASDYGYSSDDRSLIFLRTCLPFQEETLSRSYQRVIATRMIRQASELLPFLDFQITRVFPDFRKSDEKNIEAGADSRDEFEAVYQFHALQRIPRNLRCPQNTGMGYQTGIESLFYASEESYPHWGSLGPVLAGAQAFEHVRSAGRSKLKGAPLFAQIVSP